MHSSRLSAVRAGASVRVVARLTSRSASEQENHVERIRAQAHRWMQFTSDLLPSYLVIFCACDVVDRVEEK